jgi:hypothetical protein
MKANILILYLLPLLGFSQPVRTLIDSSNLIIEGQVVNRYEIEYKNGWNRIAEVEILTVFKGDYTKNSIQIYYHEQQFHTKIHFDEQDHFVGFLDLSDSVARTIYNHNGKFDFGSEITDDFPEFLSSYIASRSKEDRLQNLLKYVEKENNFSVISLDILMYKGALGKNQQGKLFQITSSKTDEIILNLPLEISDFYYSRCFEIADYDNIYRAITHKKIKSQVVDYLKDRLTKTSSRLVATKTLWLITELSMSNQRKMKNLLSQYESNREKVDFNDDSIDKELTSIIEYFINN